MYDPLMQNTESEIYECLQSQEPAMQQWWDQLPPHLKIDPLALPALAPPSHIVTMKYDIKVDCLRLFSNHFLVPSITHLESYCSGPCLLVA